jgi:hypothetical protein
MSTPASIAIMNEDGTITGIFVTSDGYPSHTGQVLLDAYRTPTRIADLFSYGELSFIGRNIRPEFQETHKRFSTEEDTCIFYGRDYGEDDFTPVQTWPDIGAWLRDSFGSYNYLFAHDEWRLARKLGGSPVDSYALPALTWKDMVEENDD